MPFLPRIPRHSRVVLAAFFISPLSLWAAEEPISVLPLQNVVASTKGATGLRALAVAAVHHDARIASVGAEIKAAELSKLVARASNGLTMGLSADIGRSDFQTDARFPVSGIRTPNTIGLGMSLPVYTSGRTQALETIAVNNIEAATQKRRFIGGHLIFETLRAGFDVKRDRETVKLAEASYQTLQAAYHDVAKRLKAGEATKTDLAQAQGRMAEAQANVSRAQAQLRVSSIGLERLVGAENANINLQWPENLPIASSEAEAVKLSATAPAVTSAQAATKATQANIAAIRTEAKPKVSLDGSAGTQDNSDFGYDRVNTWAVQMKLKVPILTGGVVDARVAEATARSEMARYQAEDEAAEYAETAASQWALLQASNQVIQASQMQLAAAELAKEGVRKELAVGTRTTLDLLNAERDLLAAQVGVVSALHDRAVTEVHLLAACGTLELENIPE